MAYYLVSSGMESDQKYAEVLVDTKAPVLVDYNTYPAKGHIVTSITLSETPSRMWINGVEQAIFENRDSDGNYMFSHLMLENDPADVVEIQMEDMAGNISFIEIEIVY